MSRPGSRVSSSSSSFSRTSCRTRPKRARSTYGYTRSSLCVVLTAIINTALLFAAVMVAILDAAEAADVTLDEVFKHENMTSLTDRRSSHGDLAETGEKLCDRNPVRNRFVNEADYDYTCKEIEEMASDMTLIGNGYVREVYLAEYWGEKVVVKVLRPVPDLRGQKRHLEMHRREILTLDTLRGHPNIVNMLGLCGTTIVTEYFEDSFLARIHRHGQELSIRQMVSLSLDVTRGMQAMHEIVGGVHLDMKPMQLLIDNNGHGKVNDFNSVHLMRSRADVPGEFCPTHSAKPVRMIPWRSPENVAGELVTGKTDIYALGMIFYSLINEDPPYETSESFKLALINKTRPKIDPSWHEGFMKIIQAMWRELPEDRPSARQVVAMLGALLRELS